MKTIAIILLSAICISSVADARRVHYIHWNQGNPMFRNENSDHIVKVNTNNQPQEFDQLNLICPVSKPGTRYPESHIIYSVSQEEYDSCRVINPEPKIVAICNQPYRLMYFTITFRPFTPTPGGLEFKPGQTYYFISTSSPSDLHRRVGGACATHNMRMVFKVAGVSAEVEPKQQINIESEIMSLKSDDDPTTERPLLFSYKNRIAPARDEYIYYFHPRDLIEIEAKTVSSVDKNDFGDAWKKQALKYTAAGSKLCSSGLLAISVSFLISMFL